MGEVLAGVPGAPGVAVGPVALMGERSADVPAAAPSADPATELAAALSALDEVSRDLQRRAIAAGGTASDVLEAQAMFADDPAVRAEVERRTAEGVGAARAVYDAFSAYRAAFAGAGEYLAGRVADLDDVRDRAVAACLGVPLPGVPDPGVPFVLVARDLAPADTAQLALDRVLAIVTEQGGPTSHTAILARDRGVPAVVGCVGVLSLDSGEQVAVDGGAGTVTRSPDAALVAAISRRRAEAREPRPMSGPGRTSDGRPVALLANVGGVADADAAAGAGAEGIGLFRTEFVFLDAADLPPPAEQEKAYRAVFERFGGRRVVVRVLDAGADKPLPYLTATGEPNPALGVRGVRALMRRPEVLDAQLDAVVAAAAASDALVDVMAPMVADAADARWFVERARAAGVVRAGVMVEVPSAALCADDVLAEADFVSVGTNDLAQYTLAADRQLGALAARQDPWHPAVLRLVSLVGAAGARAGKPVGVCGEAAADPELAPVLVGIGVTSLSMSAGVLGAVRAALAEVSYADCTRRAAAALAAPDAAAARAAVRSLGGRDIG